MGCLGWTILIIIIGAALVHAGHGLFVTGLLIVGALVLYLLFKIADGW